MGVTEKQVDRAGRTKEAIYKMQETFIEQLASGMKPTTAAKIAGYSNPGHAQVDLLNNERVLRELVQIYREKAVAWRRLHERAKFGLDAALSPENWESTVQIVTGKKGREHTVVIPPKANMGNVISAAKAVLEVLSKVDRGALSDQADEQDEADRASLVSAARKVLQSHSDKPDLKIENGSSNDLPELKPALTASSEQPAITAGDADKIDPEDSRHGKDDNADSKP